jgi:hypothetical protein
MKNYTSSVPMDSSISDIERLLVAHKARNISKRYTPHGEVEALQFSIASPVPGGLPIWILIPANVDGAFRVLRKRRKHANRQNENRDREQAKRTAWRLMLDWVHVQLSLIEMEQAEFLQVFLPYVWDEGGQETLYAKLAATGFKALTYQPKQEPEHEDRD